VYTVCDSCGYNAFILVYILLEGHMTIKYEIRKISLYTLALLISTAMTCGYASDSTQLILVNTQPVVAKSYVLETGTSDQVFGKDMTIGVTKRRCNSNTTPVVNTSLNDTEWAATSHCSILGIHASNAKVVLNSQDGYTVQIGNSAVDVSKGCQPRGLKLNWTVMCLVKAIS
jgi:hypothetical protein